MNELRLILLAYIGKLVEWLRTHRIMKRADRYASDQKLFKKGDIVELKDGRTGHVWRVLVKIKTGKPISCCVLLDRTDEGERFIIAPIVDKSPKFNPIIRQVTNLRPL